MSGCGRRSKEKETEVKRKIHEAKIGADKILSGREEVSTSFTENANF